MQIKNSLGRGAGAGGLTIAFRFQTHIPNPAILLLNI